MTEGTNGKGEAHVLRIADKRADKAEAVTPEEPNPETEAVAQTPEQAHAQLVESRISAARESGLAVLIYKLRCGAEPQKREIISAILEQAARMDIADRLFNRAGESFNQIAETLGGVLGYLAAQEARRKLPFWRRWRAPRPQFPSFGPHVVQETEAGPPVVPQAQAEAAKAEAKAVN